MGVDRGLKFKQSSLVSGVAACQINLQYLAVRTWSPYRQQGTGQLSPSTTYIVFREYTPYLKKTVHFCFCHNFVKFRRILTNYGRYMAKWLKLYAIYTFCTKPDQCHYTTLLNADVLNFYLTWIYYNEIAQIWCQSEEGILSQQLSCLEAIARH